MEIIDISPLVSEEFAPFPGDEPFRRNVALSIKNGDHIEVSSVSMSMHLGAHADAPSHYVFPAPSIDEVGLHPYVGPCQVFDVRGCGARRIALKDFDIDVVKTQRVLFRTDTVVSFSVWQDNFASFSPELILALHGKGVTLVGLDTPSADPAESKLLESHQALAKTNMRILENLDLRKVDSGRYFLIALPLKLKGAEAAPVRAVLLPDSAINFRS